jgi:uncharacterized protein (TIGR02246 family)
MRKLSVLSIALLAVAAASVLAQEEPPTPRPGVGGPRTDLVNDAKIRKRYERFQADWNRHDPVAMAAIWTIDGDHREPDGRIAKGRDEVQNLFAQEHATVFKDSHLDLHVDTVWFVTADVALVDGTYVLTGATDPDGKPIPPRKGHLTSIFLQERGRWWVAASRLMIPVPLVWRAHPESE